MDPPVIPRDPAGKPPPLGIELVRGDLNDEESLRRAVEDDAEGVDVTINGLRDSDDASTDFSVNIIPHTAAHTTLGNLAQGQHCNIEIDVLARYIQRMLDALPHRDNRVDLPHHI